MNALRSLVSLALLAAVPAKAQLTVPAVTTLEAPKPSIVSLAAAVGAADNIGKFKNQNVQSLLPGADVRVDFIGRGPALAQTLPFIKPLKRLPGNSFVRLQGDFSGEAAAKGNWAVGLQEHVGMGKILNDGVYYMLGVNRDTDWNSHAGQPFQGASFVLVGPEAGKEFRVGKNGVVYAGVTAGVGNYAAMNGNETAADGTVQPHWASGTALAAGVSVDGRLGKPNQKGTVQFSGTTLAFAKANRSDMHVDVNVSKKLAVGAGFRQVFVADKANPSGMDVVVPTARLSYAIGH